MSTENDSKYKQIQYRAQRSKKRKRDKEANTQKNPLKMLKIDFVTFNSIQCLVWFVWSYLAVIIVSAKIITMNEIHLTGPRYFFSNIQNAHYFYLC